MKRSFLPGILVLLAMLTIVSAYGEKKQKNDSGRLLSGRVVDHEDQPLINAVVYLTNTRTRAVKTYIVGQDGQYHFPALSPNIDYEVFAQFNGKKSDTKTMSQFDDRQQVSINLKVDTK